MKKANKIELQKRINRLAKIWVSKHVSVGTMEFHNRVGRLQARCIRELRLQHEKT